MARDTFIAGGAVLLGFTLAVSAQFTSKVRLVEVAATVLDKGRYVDDISKDRFALYDNGVRQTVSSFETESAYLSCAILLDTTGSMRDALGSIRNSLSSFLGQMRDGDAVAVYSFNTSLQMLQDFTVEKPLAKRAVLHTRAEGGTALFDALAQLTHDIAARSGKKVIVVFTDGADNSSSLRKDAAIRSALRGGIPVYTIAEGEATKNKILLESLRTISQKTGGLSYQAATPKRMTEVLQDIQSEMKHVYFLSYKAPSADDLNWHEVRVEITGSPKLQVRSKSGYYPD